MNSGNNKMNPIKKKKLLQKSKRCVKSGISNKKTLINFTAVNKEAIQKTKYNLQKLSSLLVQSCDKNDTKLHSVTLQGMEHLLKSSLKAKDVEAILSSSSWCITAQDNTIRLTATLMLQILLNKVGVSALVETKSLSGYHVLRALLNSDTDVTHDALALLLTMLHSSPQLLLPFALPLVQTLLLMWAKLSITRRNVKSEYGIIEKDNLSVLRTLKDENPSLDMIDPNYDFIKTTSDTAGSIIAEAKDEAFENLFKVICFMIEKLVNLNEEVTPDIISCVVPYGNIYEWRVRRAVPLLLMILLQQPKTESASDSFLSALTCSNDTANETVATASVVVNTTCILSLLTPVYHMSLRPCTSTTGGRFYKLVYKLIRDACDKMTMASTITIRDQFYEDLKQLDKTAFKDNFKLIYLLVRCVVRCLALPHCRESVQCVLVAAIERLAQQSGHDPEIPQNKLFQPVVYFMQASLMTTGIETGGDTMRVVSGSAGDTGLSDTADVDPLLKFLKSQQQTQPLEHTPLALLVDTLFTIITAGDSTDWTLHHNLEDDDPSQSFIKQFVNLYLIDEMKQTPGLASFKHYQVLVKLMELLHFKVESRGIDIPWTQAQLRRIAAVTHGFLMDKMMCIEERRKLNVDGLIIDWEELLGYSLRLMQVLQKLCKRFGLPYIKHFNKQSDRSWKSPQWLVMIVQGSLNFMCAKLSRYTTKRRLKDATHLEIQDATHHEMQDATHHEIQDASHATQYEIRNTTKGNSEQTQQEANKSQPVDQEKELSDELYLGVAELQIKLCEKDLNQSIVIAYLKDLSERLCDLSPVCLALYSSVCIALLEQLTDPARLPAALDKQHIKNFKEANVISYMVQYQYSNRNNSRISKSVDDISSNTNGIFDRESHEDIVQIVNSCLDQKCEAQSRYMQSSLDKRKELYSTVIEFIYTAYSSSKSSIEIKENLLTVLLYLTETWNATTEKCPFLLRWSKVVLEQSKQCNSCPNLQCAAAMIVDSGLNDMMWDNEALPASDTK